ncbi:uncharacterized protein E5676_scaffold352G004890 [Cucumis melo var. makuwa]|uniref:Uncharacterized protein LOC103486710 n=2 Tax=Cucumis melo TaxID=3656 RepID=A0A9I9CWQ2_CUCME|nr:uncharacterized protein LOC103486710 [Cucumis melo]KAA0043783.1 uncharacterized protein E6C27_scaffold236G001150 [Cucumis melo var. makuwa]TYK25350.1 uncharacterized protein E5676_scaffold352G004890 [Cucumis melo var. makuwa]
MSNTIMLRPPSSNRRQPLLASKSASGSVRFAEVAGGTTAECAAVCCCCPCVVINFLVLAIYKVPAGLCRRALRTKRRQRLKKKGVIPARRGRYSYGGYDETDIQILSAGKSLYSSEPRGQQAEETERKVMELEKEMWEIFYSTGFWRSPSRRNQTSISQ